jgi:hypothetical protein
MKKLFIFMMLMLVGMIGKAQTVDSAYVDSLYQDLAGSHDDMLMQLDDLNDSVQAIHLNLEKAHDQYRYGTLFVAAGIALQGLALVLDSKQPNAFISSIGSLSVLGGMVIWIDSHKYIGASRNKQYYYKYKGKKWLGF